MAEHSAVNRRVVGSSPTCGAKFVFRPASSRKRLKIGLVSAVPNPSGRYVNPSGRVDGVLSGWG